MGYNQWWNTFGFDPDSEVSLQKNNSTLRSVVPLLIDNRPAIDNFAALCIRPSVRQKNNI